VWHGVAPWTGSCVQLGPLQLRCALYLRRELPCPDQHCSALARACVSTQSRSVCLRGTVGGSSCVAALQARAAIVLHQPRWTRPISPLPWARISSTGCTGTPFRGCEGMQHGQESCPGDSALT
jgi:hypothetical protein